jgi:hypothetical protein
MSWVSHFHARTALCGRGVSTSLFNLIFDSRKSTLAFFFGDADQDRYELLKWEEYQRQRRNEPLRRELEWATIAREIALMNKPYSR